MRKRTGFTKHPLYKKWHGMMQRCGHYNGATQKQFNSYIKKGIKVCKEWRNNPEKFINWGVKNGYKPGLCIDRNDTNGDYEPSNCRFVTHKVNMQNARNSKRWFINGVEYKTSTEASKILGIPRTTISGRCNNPKFKQNYYAVKVYPD